MQIALKEALRCWFQAARVGREGVTANDLVDAVITLGLNHDHKEVNRLRLCSAIPWRMYAHMCTRKYVVVVGLCGCVICLIAVAVIAGHHNIVL